MKFKGTLIGAASGSIAGITASHNRGGQYFRARLIPTDPIRLRQAARRALFGALSAQWLAALTETQRDAWNDYAANTPVPDVLGDPILLSGQQQFVRTNTIKRIDSDTPILDAPTVFGTGEMPVISSVIATSALVTISLASLPTNTTAYGFLSRPQNASREFNRGPWRFLDKSSTPSVAAPPSFVLSTDQRVWVYVRFLNDDGRLSQKAFHGPTAVTTAGP